MILQLASFASFLLVVAGMAIFTLALRRASQMMSHARGIIEAVKACSKDLDRALEVLQAERDRCEKLGESLDSQLKHGRKARSELIQTIGLVERIRTGVATKAAGAAAQRTQPAPEPRPAPDTAVDAAAGERKLPAFVHRTVKSVHAAQQLG